METQCNNAAGQENTEYRCSCRQLVAIKTNEGLAIKCKRCKRIHLIPVKDLTTKERKP